MTATTPEGRATDQAIADRDARIAALETDLRQTEGLLAACVAAGDAPGGATLFGVNYPMAAKIGWPTPRAVRIFQSTGGPITTATKAALDWCRANRVRPTLSLKTSRPGAAPVALTEAGAASLAPYGDLHGDVTTDHEPTNDGYESGPYKAARTVTNERILRLAPGWRPGYICMGYDGQLALTNVRHPSRWMVPTDAFVGFDTYDKDRAATTWLQRTDKAVAWAQGAGLAIKFPEFACPADKYRVPGYRDDWIVDTARLIQEQGAEDACWFDAVTGVPDFLLPEGWTLADTPGIGGLSTYRGVLA